MTDNTEAVVEQPVAEPAPAAEPQGPATPEDIASTFFTLFHAKAIQGINQLSNKDLRRVLAALMEVPLLRPEHGITNTLAKDVYLWVDQIIKSKTMLELTTLYASGLLDQTPETIDKAPEVSDNVSNEAVSGNEVKEETNVNT